MPDRHPSIDVISSQPNWSEMEEIKFCNLSAEFCLKLTGARRPKRLSLKFFCFRDSLTCSPTAESESRFLGNIAPFVPGK